MKKHLQILALIAAFCMPWMGYAQTLDEYGFATGTDASKWITVPTSITSLISANAGDYGVSSVQSLGFSFPFAEGSYTQFSVNADGNLCLGSTVTGTSYYSTPFSSTNANYNSPKINMMGCDGYVSSNHYVRYLHTADANGDSVGVVEFCVGTYNSTTRDNLYKWQVHLYHNGTVEVVFGAAPAAGPAVSQQRGLCTSASDGLLVDANHAVSHFTSGSSATISSGVWPTNGRYYTFTRSACDCIVSLPYTEDFESYGTGTTAFPSCWTRIGSTADSPYIYSTTSYGHNNSYGLYFYAALGGYCYAVMPPVSNSIDSLQVTFWSRQFSTSYNCSMVVGVMTNPNDISTFVALDTVHPNTTTYEQFDVSLSSYTGTGSYIAFSSIPASGSYNYLMLDDVDVHSANVVTSDTLVIHDTITIHDTVNVPYFVHDTLFVHDTVTFYDTVGADLIYHSIELMSRDLTRGMVAGKGVFPEGTAVEIAAVPIRGNKFVRWSDGSTQQIRTVTVDGDISLTASFESLGRVGIDDIMETAFEVSAEQGAIVVKDAMGEGVRVFDVSGCLLYQGRVETEVWRLGVSTSGTYFVQIADSPAQKVVVMR